MGRGRAKAKQTKVARALKYGGPQTDLQRLQEELSGNTSSDGTDTEDPYEDDPYAEALYAKYLDEGEDGVSEQGS